MFVVEGIFSSTSETNRIKTHSAFERA